MAHRLPRRHLPLRRLGTAANPIPIGFDGAKVVHLPDWHKLTHPQRLSVMRKIAMARGRDPRLARLAVRIFRQAEVEPREHKKQAAVLLKWVQDNIYFINEPGEKLQDPIRTLRDRQGDCDDLTILLAALFESVNLPWKFVISGTYKTGDQAHKIRYIEGEPFPPWATNVKWTHVYLMVGTPPFHPNTWYFCEPTIKKVPLGWDVVSGDHSVLPEMMTKKPQGPERIVQLGRVPVVYGQPQGDSSSWSREAAYSASQDVLSAVKEAEEEAKAVLQKLEAEAPPRPPIDWRNVGVMVLTYVTVSVTSALVLDWLNSRGIWARKEDRRPAGGGD